MEILQQYSIPAEHVHRWARFCEGSPRFANIIGGNIRNSTDLLADPDTISPSLTERYIAGQDNLNNQTVKDRLLIIRFLSLFKRFGYQQPVSAEADAIYQLIHEYEPSISRARFDESIQNLHDRRILQGERTYYITPKPLQVKLWIEWWSKHASAFDIEKFNKLPPLLVEGFNDMFRFAQRVKSRNANRRIPFRRRGALRRWSPSQQSVLELFLSTDGGAPEKALSA